MRIPSLPDWAFYPVIALVIGGLITVAFNLGERRIVLSPEEIRENGIIFEGDQFLALAVGPGLTSEYLVEGDRSFARILADRGPLDGIQSAGVFFALDDRQLEALQGHDVEIHAVLRSGGELGADGARVNLFLPGRGQTAWHRFALSDTFETYTLPVSVRACEWTIGMLGVWPDWDTTARVVDVERLEIQVTGPSDRCA